MSAEVNAVRTAIHHWETGLNRLDPKPDGQLGAIVEVMLGTSARIGEVLALRRSDVDVTGAPPNVCIAGTIVIHRGQPVTRQEHPKTSRSHRVVAIPSFTAEALRRRLAAMSHHGSDALIFSTRKGTPLTTYNVRRQLRQAMNIAGITGEIEHMAQLAAHVVRGQRSPFSAAEQQRVQRGVLQPGQPARRTASAVQEGIAIVRSDFAVFG